MARPRAAIQPAAPSLPPRTSRLSTLCRAVGAPPGPIPPPGSWHRLPLLWPLTQISQCLLRGWLPAACCQLSATPCSCPCGHMCLSTGWSRVLPYPSASSTTASWGGCPAPLQHLLRKRVCSVQPVQLSGAAQPRPQAGPAKHGHRVLSLEAGSSRSRLAESVSGGAMFWVLLSSWRGRGSLGPLSQLVHP